MPPNYKGGESMLDMAECRFAYGGVESSTYNLMFAHVDTENIRQISGRKTGSFVFNKATKSRYLVGDTYDDSALELDVEIVTCDGSALGLSYVAQIERWLFSNSTFKKLTFNPNDNRYDIEFDDDDEHDADDYPYFNCRFLYPERIENEKGIVGFKCVLQTDSRMMWAAPTCVRVEMGESRSIVTPGSDIIIKGDANGNQKIDSKDVQICRAIAAYGTPNPLDPQGSPMYSISSFFDENGDIIQANEAMLNRIPLPQPITKDSLIRCLIACDPYYTQDDYDNNTPIDFCDIKEEYADIIEMKRMSVESESPVIVVKDSIIKGDADGDGEVSASDASICLKIATLHTAGYTLSSFFDQNGDVIPETEAILNTIPLPKPITLKSFTRCLIACDQSLTQEEFDDGYVPEITNINVDDAQTILKLYIQRVSQLPYEYEYIDVSGKSYASATDTILVVLPVDTDGDGYVYPVIELAIGKVGGDIEIENTTDYKEGLYTSSDRKTVISATTPNSTITLNSELNMIQGISYNNLTKRYFPRLLPSRIVAGRLEGINQIIFKGDINLITITFRTKRFL